MDYSKLSRKCQMQRAATTAYNVVLLGAAMQQMVLYRRLFWLLLNSYKGKR